MTQLPYANLGAGRIILPGERPYFHGLVDESIYFYPLWRNIDRNPEPGIDDCVDLFAYPWPFADNSFDGALCSHLLEHVPHEIRFAGNYEGYLDDSFENKKAFDERWYKLAAMQDGWFAFMHELWRVCTPGAIIHILAPYGWSQGAITDPTHTRLLTEHTFTHSLKPDPDAPFAYQTGGLHLEMEGGAVFHPTEMFQHLANSPVEFTRALQTHINVVYEFMVKLRVVK